MEDEELSVQWMNSIGNFFTRHTKHAKPEDGGLCFCIQPHKLLVSKIGHGDTLQFSDAVPIDYNDPISLAHSLKSLVAEYGLIGEPCSIILSYADYKLTVTDALPVPDAELAQALYWNVKDLLEYPADDVAYTSFRLPAITGSKKSQRAIFVTSLQSKLEQYLKIFTEAYLQVKQINIADLALVNLVSYISADQARFESSTTIVVDRFGDEYRLLIINEGSLHVIRMISLDGPAAVVASVVNKLAVELQRSIAFCDHNLKIAPVTKIIISAIVKDAPEVAASLQKTLQIPTTTLVLNDLIAGASEAAANDTLCMYCVGHELARQSSSMVVDDGAPLLDQTVNFLTALPKQPVQFAANSVFMVAVTIVGALIAYTVLQQGIVMQYQKEAIEYNQEFELARGKFLQLANKFPELGRQQKFVDQIRQKQQELAGREILWENIKEHSAELGFVAYLQPLTQLTPEGVWLTKIDIDQIQRRISLTGMSLTPLMASEFAKSLMQNKVYAEQKMNLFSVKAADNYAFVLANHAADSSTDRNNANN